MRWHEGLAVCGVVSGLVGGFWRGDERVRAVESAEPGGELREEGHALEVRQKDGLLRIEVDAPEVLHVTYAPLDQAAPERACDHVIVKRDWGAEFGVSSDEKTVTLTTAKLKVRSSGRGARSIMQVRMGSR